MTQINGFGAYQNTMMNSLNQKQKADADKTTKKAEEQERIRAAKRNERAEKSDKAGKTQDTEVQLSDRAKALLEELKSKYGNMDFFVADYSTEEEAQSYLSRGTKEFSVLIDPATLEAMAADEETKNKYTGMIDEATSRLAEMKDKLAEDDGTEVKRIGITINDDGTMSMFAELEQISERRREAIAREREARKAEAEAAEKQAEKKADQKQDEIRDMTPEEAREAHAAMHDKVREFVENQEKANVGGIPQASGKHPAVNLFEGFIPRDEKVKRTIVSADNVEDLLSKIQNVNWDEIEATENKPPVGGKFNFSV
ncbi:MAG: hypothetical protein J5819_06485 [Eubacterium sp.]|nr:hypothetical protein [Eubacterium sp.]